MNSTEIIQLFAKDYEKWLKLSKGNNIYYEKTLSAKQAKWFLDVLNQERKSLIYITETSGKVEIDSKTMYYHLLLIRDGAAILRVEPLNL